MEINSTDIKNGLCVLTLTPENDKEQEQLREIIETKFRGLGSNAAFSTDGSLLCVNCLQFIVVANSGFEQLLEEAKSFKPTPAHTLTRRKA